MNSILYHLKHPGLILVVVGIFLVSSCKKEDDSLVPIQETSYNFFVAGHTYGQPGVDNKGLHPPFQDKFDFINQRQAKMGFLTGDIVPVGTEKNWNEVDSVLKFLDADVYFAVGNHDMSDRQLFENRYGITYFDFSFEDDLFIILDPNIDEWNISGAQLEFLKNVLNSKANVSRNIFVFFHQLLWWDRHNKYRNVRLNSTEGRADSINFWTEVEPLFHKLPNNVYMFAGDLGAGSWSDNFMYDHYDNITFIASGMGEGNGDNFVIVKVGKENISFELIALNENEVHSLGDFKDYMLP